MLTLLYFALGLLNRLSEANVESISGEIFSIYQVCHFYSNELYLNKFRFSFILAYERFLSFKQYTLNIVL